MIPINDRYRTETLSMGATVRHEEASGDLAGSTGGVIEPPWSLFSAANQMTDRFRLRFANVGTERGPYRSDGPYAWFRSTFPAPDLTTRCGAQSQLHPDALPATLARCLTALPFNGKTGDGAAE
jgi:hypothetical protein